MKNQYFFGIKPDCYEVLIKNIDYKSVLHMFRRSKSMIVHDEYRLFHYFSKIIIDKNIEKYRILWSFLIGEADIRLLLSFYLIFLKIYENFKCSYLLYPLK